MNLEEKITERIKPIEFLWLGLYSFAGFSIELILGLVANILGMDAMGKGLNSFLTGVLWFACAMALIQYAKSKFNYDVFKIRQRLTIPRALVIMAIIVLIIAVTAWGFGGFKPYVEFHNGSQGNIVTYLLQVFYYLGETALIVLTIAFGQQFFEKQFAIKPKFPGGGIFLAATWGVLHFFLQGVSGGIYTILFSILAGIIYVIIGKDFKWAYLFIALAFIL